MVWTGEGSPTLAERSKRLPEFHAKNRRPIDRAFVHSIFNRDHPGTADDNVIEAFADEILTLDDSVPTGTYVDMCSQLPVVDPEKITVPTLIMRGQWDGIASFEDLLEFFAKLPNPDKQFTVMPGISHASFQQKNYMMVYHILLELLRAARAGLSRIRRKRWMPAEQSPRRRGANAISRRASRSPTNGTPISRSTTAILALSVAPRDRPFLEIGCQRGGSLETARRYFGGSARIFGVDIDPSCGALNGQAFVDKVFIGDASMRRS